jgi:hypothetical protein
MLQPQEADALLEESEIDCLIDTLRPGVPEPEDQATLSICTFNTLLHASDRNCSFRAPFTKED